MKWFYLLLTLAGGLAVGMQAAINGGLGKKVGSIEATFISFCIGTAALFFMVLFWGKGNILAERQYSSGIRGTQIPIDRRYFRRILFSHCRSCCSKNRCFNVFRGGDNRPTLDQLSD